MNRRIRSAAAVLVILCLAVIIGAGCGSAPTAAQPPKEPEPPKVEVSVKATDLYADYKANQVAADGKYKGKLLEITGEVDTIGKDVLDTLYVTLKGDAYFGNVQCYFPDSAADALAKLKSGDNVVIQGKGDGYLMNVSVKDCALVTDK